LSHNFLTRSSDSERMFTASISAAVSGIVKAFENSSCLAFCR
jgi:hypothetical protein